MNGTSVLPDVPALAAADRDRLARMLGHWEVLVDPSVGVVNQVSELPTREDDPNLFHYASRACDTQRFTRLRNFGVNGGASVHRYVAMAKAIGEAVERYCSAIYDLEDLTLAPYGKLDAEACHPDQFACYTDEQYAQEGFDWQPFTVDTPAHWTVATSLLDGRKVLVPAAAVYIPYHYLDREITGHVMQPISTGLACGSSFAGAVISGLSEVIERDAFSITWQARLSHPLIRHESVPSRVLDLIRRFEAVGIEVKLMDMTGDIEVPTILSIGLCDAETSPALALAAATDPDPEQALMKTLEELAHTRKYAKQVMEYVPELEVDIANGHPQVRDQMDHLRFYCPQSSKAFAEFAWASSERRDFEELARVEGDRPEETVEVMVAQLAEVGLEPYMVDLTSEDIRPLGLRSIRCLAPGAHPMLMGYRSRALALPRLYSVPQKLGFRGLDPGEPDNPYPHPFP